MPSMQPLNPSPLTSEQVDAILNAHFREASPPPEGNPVERLNWYRGLIRRAAAAGVALPNDAARLDWLAHREHSFEFCVPGDHVAKKAWLLSVETGQIDRQGKFYDEFDGDTLREAIDAAMKVNAGAQEPRLGWCAHCGEGVTTFCRGALAPCPKGLTQTVAAGVRTPDGGQHGKPAPLTQEEAQVLAAKVCTEYLSACRIAAGPNEREHIGNYLMKLASVAGVVMAQAEGSEVAFDRLIGAAQFILNNMPRKPSRLERLQ